MFVLGLIILLGLVIHLWNFWYRMQFAELMGNPDAVTGGSVLVKELFSSAPFVVIYLIWLGALWFHLTHGVWSAFQTLGMNGKIWYPRLKMIANIVSTLIVICFADIPVYFLAVHLLYNL
jgi:succinate dehydrogenase / fumarate reductase cytochrome b subunit